MDLTKWEVMPQYFLVKIPKEDQKKNKEYISEHILGNPATVSMTREIQFGVIEQIGSEAAEYFTEAKIGDYLLLHHFATGKKDDKGYNYYLLTEDKEFNYYAVNAFEFNGERNLTYGVYSDGKIIPNRDFIFLEPFQEESKIEIQVESVFNGGGTMNLSLNADFSDTGLIRIKNQKTRQDWVVIMKNNMERMKQLARNVPQSPQQELMMYQDIRKRELAKYSYEEIRKLERENTEISKRINKKRYELYKTIAINKDWNDGVERSFGERIKEGDFVYMISLACTYEIEVFGKKYIVAGVNYFGGSLNYMKKVVNDFKCNNITSKKRTSNKRNQSVRN